MIVPHNGIYKYHGVFFSRMKATTRSDHSAISFEYKNIGTENIPVSADFVFLSSSLTVLNMFATKRGRLLVF